MILVRMVPASPFVRKCRIAAAHLGLGDRVKFVDAPDDADDRLRKNNPLNKIPVALLEDGTALYDSVVILEYFDHIAGGGRIIPKEPTARFQALTLQALADGIMDAAILISYESRYREPSMHSPKWLDMQQGKVDMALDHLEKAPPAGVVDVGQISLACALGFLDLRHGAKWRDGRPNLARWLDDFAAKVPGYEATRAAQ
jgi:glutathione S-transferase